MQFGVLLEKVLVNIPLGRERSSLPARSVSVFERKHWSDSVVCRVEVCAALTSDVLVRHVGWVYVLLVCCSCVGAARWLEVLSDGSSHGRIHEGRWN